jgi:hypothetical protein
MVTVALVGCGEVDQTRHTGKTMGLAESQRGREKLFVPGQPEGPDLARKVESGNVDSGSQQRAALLTVADSC